MSAEPDDILTVVHIDYSSLLLLQQQLLALALFKMAMMVKLFVYSWTIKPLCGGDYFWSGCQELCLCQDHAEHWAELL